MKIFCYAREGTSNNEIWLFLLFSLFRSDNNRNENNQNNQNNGGNNQNNRKTTETTAETTETTETAAWLFLARHLGCFRCFISQPRCLKLPPRGMGPVEGRKGQRSQPLPLLPSACCSCSFVASSITPLAPSLPFPCRRVGRREPAVRLVGSIRPLLERITCVVA